MHNTLKNTMRKYIFIIYILLACTVCSSCTSTDSENSLEQLENRFTNLDTNSRPYTYWFWMNGNITKEGITKDLEAMHEIGIGGVFNLEGGTGIPKGKVEYLSEEWSELKAHAIKEASRLGIEFVMHNCPGWSSSGGPWITPDLAMQTLTWSEVDVVGGSDIKQILAKPQLRLDYYKDIAVIAYPSFSNGRPVGFSDWKLLNNSVFNYEGKIEIEEFDSQQIIDVNKVVDLSIHLDGDTLSWENAPDGRWTIIRIGHTPTGRRNASAPDTGVGLECDKFSKKAIQFHFNKMMDILYPLITPYLDKVTIGLEIDSWEVGMQNWTMGYEKIFEEKKGYNLIKYLPAMTGKLVGDKMTTEQFLWDMRQTQAELLADNYYGEFRKLCNEKGFLSYTEPYDRGPMEELQIGSRVDMVLGEFWNGLSAIFQNNLMMRRTSKLASSIAHTNGQKVVGAEAYTSEPESGRWQEYPFGLKAVGDKAFTEGLNRMVIHRYAQQPHPSATPGMTLGPWGIHFERTNTLWEPSKAWMDYLNRCQTMLQEGLFVADFAYFIGERVVGYTKVHGKDLTPALLKGYDYDLINSETLIEKASVKDGRLCLPDGMSYKVLFLQDQEYMTLELLRKIHTMIKDGLVVVGKRPLKPLGLSNNSAENIQEFNRLCDEIWGDDRDKPLNRRIGKGQVFQRFATYDVMAQINLKHDFLSSSKVGDAPIRYIHRRIKDADVYFISNQRRSYEDIVASFRVEGKQPEFWDPVTGIVTKAILFKQEGEHIQVPIQLPPYGSLFVVFKDKVPQKSIEEIRKDGNELVFARMFDPADRILYPEVKSDFLIECWVKPESDIMLTTDPHLNPLGYQKDYWTEYYAVYPSAGEKLYGKGHVTCGFLVGRNGVAIWENGNGTPQFRLAAENPISGWTHIVVSYRENIPYIYIDGELKAKGAPCKNIVHPGLGQAYMEEGASYYAADMSTSVLHQGVLSDTEVKNMANNSRCQEVDRWKIINYTNLSKEGMLDFFENGVYELKSTDGTITKVVIEKKPNTVEITEPWSLSIPLSTEEDSLSIKLEKLTSLHHYDDERVKYFSGTSIYNNYFSISTKELDQEKRLFLDLGEVEVMAQVFINGVDLGVLWTRPYIADITDFVQEGKNELEIRVTNQWVNRLIGDEQLPEENPYSSDGGINGLPALSRGAIKKLPDWYIEGLEKPEGGRTTFTTWDHFREDSPLLQAGLIGPVKIRCGLAKVVK